MKKETKEKYIPYIQLLRDPRWQKKRLKIMERDHFMCTSCGDTEETLNVHHTVQYRKNTKPWEYEDEELTTLCEPCHKEISEIIDACTAIIIKDCYCIDTARELYELMCELDSVHISVYRDTYEMLHFKRTGRHGRK